jgi:hypothetical protein
MNIKIIIYFVLSILAVLSGTMLYPELGAFWIFALFMLIFTIPIIAVLIMSVITYNLNRKEKNVIG